MWPLSNIHLEPRELKELNRLVVQTSFTSLWSFWLASSDFVTSLLAAASCSSISPTWRDATKGHMMTQIKPTWVSVNCHSTKCKQTWQRFTTKVCLVIVRLLIGIDDLSVTWWESYASNLQWPRNRNFLVFLSSSFILSPDSQGFIEQKYFVQLFIFTKIFFSYYKGHCCTHGYSI